MTWLFWAIWASEQKLGGWIDVRDISWPPAVPNSKTTEDQFVHNAVPCLLLSYFQTRVEHNLNSKHTPNQLRIFSDFDSKKSNMDPDLFIRPDGRPILFLMSESNPERKEVRKCGLYLSIWYQLLRKAGHWHLFFCQVKKLVEEGGGVVMADLPSETSQELQVFLKNNETLFQPYKKH